MRTQGNMPIPTQACPLLEVDCIVCQAYLWLLLAPWGVSWYWREYKQACQESHRFKERKQPISIECHELNIRLRWGTSNWTDLTAEILAKGEAHSLWRVALTNGGTDSQDEEGARPTAVGQMCGSTRRLQVKQLRCTWNLAQWSQSVDLESSWLIALGSWTSLQEFKALFVHERTECDDHSQGPRDRSLWSTRAL